MKAIVAIGAKGGIGKDGKLLFHIAEDMKRFKEFTSTPLSPDVKKNTCIMGRKTFESLPNMELPGRNIIVITNHADEVKKKISPERYETLDGDVVFWDNDMLEAVQENPELFQRHWIVCGGESIYKILLPYCNSVYMTATNCEAEADAFFPPLNEWKWDGAEMVISESPALKDNATGLIFQSIAYHKLAKY